MKPIEQNRIKRDHHISKRWVLFYKTFASNMFIFIVLGHDVKCFPYSAAVKIA